MLKNKAIIEKMTLKQKVSMLSGKNTWESYDVPNLLPSLFLSDGPHGVRKQLGASDHLGLNESQKATCFPTAATLANSWDEALLTEVGRCLGKEASALNVQVLLGPGLNIKRHPRCGRNFEYYSEDPFLSGKLAAASIRGIQENGTIACPKHFAVNSQEYRRMTSDSIVDERTLREIYTTGFEIAVKEAKPLSIMSSYNLINGVYANENSFLLRDMLRHEWNFEGFVVSDWGGDNDHVQGVINGSHLAMPSPGVNGPIELMEAIQTGVLSEEILDERVDELISVVLKSTAMNPDREQTFDQEAHHDVAREAAKKSIVLLKNENHVLPIKQKTKVGIIGEFAKQPRYQGAGSSVVNPTKLENILDQSVVECFDYIGYAAGYKRGTATDHELVAEAKKLAEQCETVIVFAGLDESFESEGMDRVSLKMPQNQIFLIEALAELDVNVVVSLAAGSVIAMPWENKVDAIVHGYLSGQAGASAMLEVLTGAYNPSGKLTETYPMSEEDVLFNEEYPAKGTYAYYKEGLFVGYRYYDSVEKQVRFPFGFGLSYTTFSYENIEVSATQVSFDLKNTGQVAGEEIVQLYVTKENSAIIRPAQELKGFVKVKLEPGETQTVLLPLDEMTFRYFDTHTKSWQVEQGTYQIKIGSHSRAICLSQTIEIEGTSIDIIEDQTQLPSYYNADFNAFSISEFERLYGAVVPVESTAERRELHRNSVISEMKYANSFLSRQVYKIINRMLEKSQQKGKPDLNLLFIYNMPFRAIAKMTNGMVSLQMVDDIVFITNGHFWRGLGRLIRDFFKNKKISKQWLTD